MKTHWKKLDNPNYLGAYSLLDGSDNPEITATIDKVITEEVKSDRGSEQCRVMYLRGLKPMILNVTNSKAIAKATGSPYIEDWAGKKITIYVAKIKAFGETVEALRIREKSPSLPELTPNSDKWNGALKAINEGTVTIDQIKKKYSVSPQNEKLLCGSK